MTPATSVTLLELAGIEDLGQPPRRSRPRSKPTTGVAFAEQLADRPCADTAARR